MCAFLRLSFCSAASVEEVLHLSRLGASRGQHQVRFKMNNAESGHNCSEVTTWVLNFQKKIYVLIGNLPQSVQILLTQISCKICQFWIFHMMEWKWLKSWKRFTAAGSRRDFPLDFVQSPTATKGFHFCGIIRRAEPASWNYLTRLFVMEQACDAYLRLHPLKGPINGTVIGSWSLKNIS